MLYRERILPFVNIGSRKLSSTQNHGGKLWCICEYWLPKYSNSINHNKPDKNNSTRKQCQPQGNNNSPKSLKKCIKLWGQCLVEHNKLPWNYYREIWIFQFNPNSNFKHIRHFNKIPIRLGNSCYMCTPGDLRLLLPNLIVAVRFGFRSLKGATKLHLMHYSCVYYFVQYWFI